MEKKESLRSISKRLGLSPSTVYRALNSCGDVSSETSARIRQLVDGGDYRISEGRSTLDCAVILPSKPDWFWGRFRTSFDDRLQGLSLRFFLYPGMDDGEGFCSAFSDAVSLNPAIALVAAPDLPMVREMMKDPPFPIFFFCESVPLVNSFFFGAAPVADGYALGQAFSERFPHCRSLLYVRSELRSSLSEGRTEGFLQGASGLSNVQSISLDGGLKPYAAALLARRLADSPSFDCVYCDNGLLSELCLALQKCRVPLSVPCVGFENPPALNTFRESGRALLISAQDSERQVDLCTAAARRYLTTHTFPDRKFFVIPSFVI